jgi:hypothetical protein
VFPVRYELTFIYYADKNSVKCNPMPGGRAGIPVPGGKINIGNWSFSWRESPNEDSKKKS